MKLVIFGIFLLFISSQALTCNEIRSAFFIKNNCDADDTCKTVCDDLKNSFKSQNCSCDTVTGTVIDGPLENALVFADINENGIQDADEPWTITDYNGHYTIEMEEIIVTSSLIATSTANTMDTSTGEMVPGVTLKAPTGAAVISPISDLVHKISKRNSLNTNDAVLKVTQTLGLSDEIDVLDLNPYSIVDTDSANNLDDITSVRVQTAAAYQLIEAVQDVETLLAIVIDPIQTLNNSMSELYEEDDIETMSVLLNAKKMTEVVDSSITLAQTKNAIFSSEATTIQTASFQQVKNIDCYSENVCVANWDPSDSGCVATEYKSKDTGCNDGLDTTKDDICNDAGQCTGTTITCDANTQCTTYQPNGVDCDITHKANNTVCDDNSDITAGDVCDGAGQCAGTIIIYPNNTQCTTYSPNGVGYDTVHKEKDTTCDDNSDTTKDDVCDGAGECSGTPFTCDANTQCTTYQANGEDCDTVHKAEGTVCDDGSSSTKNDLCDGTGQCIGCSENDPNYNVPGCCGNYVVIDANSCDNDHRCAGLAFAESLNACSGCEAGTNTRITQNNVGDLTPPAILCSNTTSSGSSNYSSSTNITGSSSSMKYTCNDGDTTMYMYQNADCSGTAAMQMDLSTMNNCMDEDDGTSVQFSCDETHVTGTTFNAAYCSGDEISSRTIPVGECQVSSGGDDHTAHCTDKDGREGENACGWFTTQDSCEDVDSCEWHSGDNHTVDDDDHDDHGETYTYKTQEGGYPEYNETAAECNEGENEADSPCKCTSCSHIEIYMIKKGQFCINGNWSLTN